MPARLRKCRRRSSNTDTIHSSRSIILVSSVSNSSLSRSLSRSRSRSRSSRSRDATAMPYANE